MQGRRGPAKFKGRKAKSTAGKAGEVVMTQEFTHIPEQSSRFNNFVIGTLMSTMIILAGLLSFAPYSLI